MLRKVHASAICKQSQRTLLGELHPWLTPADIKRPAAPLNTHLVDEDLYKLVAPKLANPPPDTSRLLEFNVQDQPHASDDGKFVTTVPYECAAEAREDLALVYGPGERLDLGPRVGFADARSLYGAAGHKNRTWPAYGSFGGGWETLILKDVKLTPRKVQPTCGGIASDLSYAGYQGGPLSFSGIAGDFAEWVRRGGHAGKLPWRRSLAKIGESPVVEAPNREPFRVDDREVPEDSLPEPDRMKTMLRTDGQDCVSVGWDKGFGWRWALSAARWQRRLDSGISFWGYAWYDAKDTRYVVGPIRPVDQLPNMRATAFDRPTRTWYRLTSLVWELTRILDSPAPGIREIPLHA